MMKHRGFHYALLGLNDYTVTGVYQWDNGEPVDYTNWTYNEPNNSVDAGYGPEHVAAIGFSVYSGAWMDVDPDPTQPFPVTWIWLTEDNKHPPAIVETPVDPLPPIITLVGSRQKSVALGAEYTEEGAIALDNLDGDLSDAVVITSTPPLSTNAIGEYILEYTVSDAAGNAATPVTRKVHVLSGEDTRPPGIILLGCMALPGEPCINILATGDAYVAGRVQILDDWDGDITSKVDVKTYALSDIAIDVNRAETVSFTSCLVGPGCLAQIDIGDMEAGDGAVVIVGDTVSWYELTVIPASPNQKLGWEKRREIDISGAAPADNNIDASTGGVYVTRYNAMDSSGNAAPETDRLIIVKDALPTITILGDQALGLRMGDEYEEFGATIADLEDCVGTIRNPGSCDEDDDPEIYSRLEIGGDVVDTNRLGQYAVTYNVTDSFGNAAEEVRRVVTVYGPYGVQKASKDPSEVRAFGDFSGGCYISTILPE